MSFDRELDDEDVHAVIHLHRRSISEEQMRKFESDVAAIFEAFGLDLHTPATERTPQRFLQALFDIGISKLTRLVRLFAKRFTVQERIGQQIADTLEAMLAPHGVAVYLEATHLCTQMRGVRESESTTRTTFWRGNYESNPQLREEFLNIARSRGDGHFS